MSGNIVEKNNSFEDCYNIDNFDDNELQARLYAEIYYESNIESKSGTMDSSRAIKLDSIAIETNLNVESEMTQHEPEEQSLTSETRANFQKKIPSTDQSEFVQVETLSSREMNPTHGHDNKISEVPSIIQGKESEENSPKSKSSKYAKLHVAAHKENCEKDSNDIIYSKYNVVSKYMKQKMRLLLAQQMDKDEDSSDSEESILEVPIPPKPKPPLIDLQDSDEENDSRIDKNDLILKNWSDISVKTVSRTHPFKNGELEIPQVDHPQDTSSKNKNSARSYNKDANCGKSIHTSTHMQDFTEDIVLNCTTIQRGAKSISEIKQLSKNAINQQKLTDTSQNYKKTLLQNKSKENNKNTNLQQKISGKKLQTIRQNVNKSNVHNVYNLRPREQNRTAIESSSNSVIDRKRRCNDEVNDQSKQKRQCIIQQNNQDVTPQGNSTGEKRNISNEFFEPMSEKMKNYYNSSHSQENFDISKLQQGMSKDPRMWTILDEDLMPSPSKRSFRFWNIKCTNCQQDGHRRCDCPIPRRSHSCYMCGMKGHTEIQCSQKMCLTCGKQQNTFRNTCEYCRVLYCTMCDSIGHEQKQCPDLWRRYHQTTDMNSTPQNPGNVMKSSRLLYCCNCAKRGHESSTCRAYRWSENFPTPAAVTNYTDGPMYKPSSSHVSDFLRPNLEIDFSFSETRENETSIPQSTNNVQQTVTEDVESSINLDTLPSDINFCISPITQETEHVSQTKDNFESSFIWPTVERVLKQTKVDYVTFSKIISSYGFFRNKNDKDARMILITLNTFFAETAKNFHMIKNLVNHETAPNFLQVLQEKTKIKFEVKIGYTHHKTLSLQLIALKEYIECLYDLLKYWLNLPEDEKDYGIDVTLSTKSTKMFNNLQSREQQLKKMRFRCYPDHIGGPDDPRMIYQSMNVEKNRLKQHQGSKHGYIRLRRRVFRSQIKLLMITNTEPKPNVYVRTFEIVMGRFKERLHQMNENLDTATYLRLILLYNQLFVPHTSPHMHKMLQRIELEEKKINDSLQMQELEIRHVPEKQQEPEIYCIPIEKQQNLVCTSTVYTSSTTPMPLNINFENSFVINNQQNEILDEEQNVDDTSLETSKITNYKHDEITITINNSLAQDLEIVPSNTVPVSSVQSEEPERNEDQLSTSEVKIDSNVSANKQDVNINNTHLSKKERRKKLREKKLIYLTNQMLKSKDIYVIASDLIKKAHAFKLPHMMGVANAMQKQIKNGTIKPKHVRALSKMIDLEKKHQKTIGVHQKTICCKLLKKK